MTTKSHGTAAFVFDPFQPTVGSEYVRVGFNDAGITGLGVTDRLNHLRIPAHQLVLVVSNQKNTSNCSAILGLLSRFGPPLYRLLCPLAKNGSINGK